MNKLLTSDKIYISQSSISQAGRGVFARMDITKGKTIERCPVIEITADDVPRTNESMLVTYMYYLGENKKRQVIALGFGSIYNHTDTPNAIYKENNKEKTIDFIALKKIKKDEEITVNYGQGNPKNTHPLWFTVAV